MNAAHAAHGGQGSGAAAADRVGSPAAVDPVVFSVAAAVPDVPGASWGVWSGQSAHATRPALWGADRR